MRSSGGAGVVGVTHLQLVFIKQHDRLMPDFIRNSTLRPDLELFGDCLILQMFAFVQARIAAAGPAPAAAAEAAAQG